MERCIKIYEPKDFNFPKDFRVLSCHPETQKKLDLAYIVYSPKLRKDWILLDDVLFSYEQEGHFSYEYYDYDFNGGYLTLVFYPVIG